MLTALPGVYRIARFDREGKFGRERGEKRRQVRALMAVSERALQAQPLGRGGWATPWDYDHVVLYDPVQWEWRALTSPAVPLWCAPSPGVGMTTKSVRCCHSRCHGAAT